MSKSKDKKGRTIYYDSKFRPKKYIPVKRCNSKSIDGGNNNNDLSNDAQLNDSHDANTTTPNKRQCKNLTQSITDESLMLTPDQHSSLFISASATRRVARRTSAVMLPQR